MAPKVKTKAAPEVPEVDYSNYRDKAPTDLQTRFADWLIDKVEPVAHDEEGNEVDLDLPSFEEGVRLGVALRMVFQASPENQAVLAENRAAREEEEAKPAKAKAAPAKRKTKAVAEEEPEEAEEDSEEEAEEDAKPAPKAKRATAKAQAARPATRRTTRGKKAAAPAAVGSDAPF